MKTFLCILVLAAIVWVACQKKEPHPTVSGQVTVRERAEDTSPTVAEKNRSTATVLAEKSREFASGTKETWDRERVELKLTDSDIRADLEKTGVLVREKSAVAGDRIGAAVDNARIVTVINTKLVADSDLSALRINVDADQGVVTLKGSVKSLELVARATAIALETQGVTRVISLLSVEA